MVHIFNNYWWLGNSSLCFWKENWRVRENWSRRRVPYHIHGSHCIPFLMTFLRNNAEATFSWHISISQELLQIDIIILASKLCINSLHVTISVNYKLVKLYSYVTRGADMVSETHRAPVNVAATWKILRHRPFWMNFYNHIKRLIVSYLGVTLVPRRMSNDDLYT